MVLDGIQRIHTYAQSAILSHKTRENFRIYVEQGCFLERKKYEQKKNAFVCCLYFASLDGCVQEFSKQLRNLNHFTSVLRVVGFSCCWHGIGGNGPILKLKQTIALRFFN